MIFEYKSRNVFKNLIIIAQVWWNLTSCFEGIQFFLFCLNFSENAIIFFNEKKVFVQLRWAIFQQQQQLQQRGVKVKFDWFFKRCFVIRRWWLLILMLAHNAEKYGKKYNNLDISYCLCLKKGYKNNTNFIFLHFTVVHFTFDKKTYVPRE